MTKKASILLTIFITLFLSSCSGNTNFSAVQQHHFQERTLLTIFILLLSISSPSIFSMIIAFSFKDLVLTK